MAEEFQFESAKVAEELRQVELAYQLKSATSFMGFVRGLMIPSAHGPKLFNLCIEQFQVDCFKMLSKSLANLRRGDDPGIRRFWIERTKKAGKDSDLAVVVLWLMAFPIRPFKCQICAANHRQARIIEDRAVELAYYNQWLNQKVEIIQGSIRNKKSPREVWTHIEATDSSGAAHGQTPDLLILNELVHVAKWKAMEDHMNNADGVPRGMVIISTNAGIRGTRAWSWREEALKNKRWRTSIWNEVAPWISKEDVEEAKRRDPIGAEYSRLWEGNWISGTGGAIGQEELERCFVLPGPITKPEPGWRYLAGLDLGVSRDHSGVSVIGVNTEEQLVKVVWVKGWKPNRPNDQGDLEVDGVDVEDVCIRVAARYKIEWFGYDPAAGGSFMAQRLRAKGVPMKEVTFSSQKNTTAMALSFVQLVKDSKLLCYDDKDGRLRRDFGKFSIRHKIPGGYKLEAVSDEFGHADVGTALIIALPRAVDLLEMNRWRAMKDFVFATPEEDERPVTEKELKSMPKELRDIYDAEEAVEVDYRRQKELDEDEGW
jgi:hypothetical protein